MSTPPPATSLKVGIDIGNSKCVIAIARNGIVDALLNEDSKRETPAVVYFSKNHRLFGAAAVASSTINPSSTISQIKRLVACNSNDPHGLSLAYKTSTGRSGEIIVEVTYDGQDYKFTPTEMLAMFLSHLRRTVKNSMGNANAFDCVIGVPSYFSDEQRKAYLNAAKIGGWKPIGLLPDGEATAVEYAYYRHDDAPTVSVVFVDIGHSDTQITVARFEGKKIELLGRSSDRDLGGRDFDEVLFNFCIEEIKKERRADIQLSKKGEARLRAACEKAKKVLTVNKEAQISVDSLMGEDYDFKRIITREEFERRSVDFLKRIEEKWTEALTDAKINKDEVRFVELVGSGSRIPAISKALTESFGRDLSRTLNGSECIACGCALLCEKIVQRLGLADEKMWNRESIGRLGISNNNFTFDGLYAIDFPRPPNQEDKLLQSQKQEVELLEKDRSQSRAKDKRNELEAYIYEVRNKRPKLEKDHIYEILMVTEEWIYGDGDDLSEKEYDNKLKELQSKISQSEDLLKEKSRIESRDNHNDRITEVDQFGMEKTITISKVLVKKKSQNEDKDNHSKGSTEIDHQRDSTLIIFSSEHPKEKSQIEDMDDDSERTIEIDNKKDSTSRDSPFEEFSGENSHVKQMEDNNNGITENQQKISTSVRNEAISSAFPGYPKIDGEDFIEPVANDFSQLENREKMVYEREDRAEDGNNKLGFNLYESKKPHHDDTENSDATNIMDSHIGMEEDTRTAEINDGVKDEMGSKPLHRFLSSDNINSKGSSKHSKKREGFRWKNAFGAIRRRRKDGSDGKHSEPIEVTDSSRNQAIFEGWNVRNFRFISFLLLSASRSHRQNPSGEELHAKEERTHNPSAKSDTDAPDMTKRKRTEPIRAILRRSKLVFGKGKDKAIKAFRKSRKPREGSIVTERTYGRSRSLQSVCCGSFPKDIHHPVTVGHLPKEL